MKTQFYKARFLLTFYYLLHDMLYVWLFKRQNFSISSWSLYLLSEGQDIRKSDKKTTVNLFVDSNILQELKSEAEAKGVSLNSNINSVLKHYVTFYRRSKELQCVILTGNDFRFHIENMEEGKMLENFKSNLTDLVPASLKQRQIPVTFQNIIEHVYEQMVIYSGIAYRFTRYYDHEGLLCLVFDHRFGIKWSRILANGLVYQIETLFGIPTRKTISSSNVEITIVDRRFTKSKLIP